MPDNSTKSFPIFYYIKVGLIFACAVMFIWRMVTGDFGEAVLWAVALALAL